jgi:integrase
MSFSKAKFGNFNPNLFKGQKVLSPVPKNQGIYYVWFWNAKIEIYEVPPKGIKRYRANRRVRVGGKSVRECCYFDQVDPARLWKINHQLERSQTETASQIEAAKGGPKFEDVVKLWMEAKWKFFEPSTRLVYERTLKYLKFFEGMEVRSISPEVIDEWLKSISKPEELKKQHTNRRTFLHELELLSGVFKYYREYKDDSLFVFPIRKRHREAAIVKIVRGKPRKPMTPEQFELWIKALRSQKHGLLKEALARTQRSGALRVGEAAAILWEDIDWNNHSIFIHRSMEWPHVKGIKTSIKEGFKNGDEKVIPLSPDAQRVLEALKENRTSDLVFNLHGEFLEYRFIQYAYDAAARSAKLDFQGTHVMRRTGASWILNQTGDIDLAKQLLGNTTWSSVTPYAHRESKAISDFNQKLWNKEADQKPDPTPAPAVRKLRRIG